MTSLPELRSGAVSGSVALPQLGSMLMSVVHVTSKGHVDGPKAVVTSVVLAEQAHPLPALVACAWESWSCPPQRELAQGNGCELAQGHGCGSLQQESWLCSSQESCPPGSMMVLVVV